MKKALTYADVLLVPRYSTIQSRKNVKLECSLGRGKYRFPVIPANMKTIISEEMTNALIQTGGLVLMHRFQSYEDQLNIINKFKAFENQIGATIGIKDEDLAAAKMFVENGVKIICIDVAHADTKQTIGLIKKLRSLYDHDKLTIIAGNIVTGESAVRLWEAGADTVKVGIGGGCFAAGTRILMSNGMYKNIQDVQIGDRVINKHGNPVNVTNVVMTGRKKTIKIRSSIHYSETEVTDDHQYWSADLSSINKSTLQSYGYAKVIGKNNRNGQSKIDWQPIGSSTNKALLMPRNINFEINNNFSISSDDSSGQRINSSYDLGYLIGAFLCCGNIEELKISWKINSKKEKIASDLVQSLNNIFSNKNLLLEVLNEKKYKIISVQNQELINLFKSFVKNDERIFPDHLLVNDKAYLKGLYDGLLDLNGSLQKYNSGNSRISFINKSKVTIELFSVVSYLVNGSFPNALRRSSEKSDNYECQILSSANKRLISDYQISKLLDVSDTTNETEVYDIEVDCESHSFIANNSIVHNSICSTRVETGNGYPQLTALKNVNKARKKIKNVYPETKRHFGIIADGGITSPGDCVKALVYADMVMAGNLFSGTDEAPGKKELVDGVMYKRYDGSSTHKNDNIEGVKSLVKAKGPVINVIKSIREGIQSGCSYQGVDDLKSLKKVAKFVKITNAGITESHPHDVKKI